MSILTALTSHLLAHSGLATLVSTRVYPEKLPASTTNNPNQMPLVTFQLMDEVIATTHNYHNLFYARMQLNAWGGTYKSAHVTADQIHAALDGYRGAMGDQSVHVGGCFRKSKRDASDENVELFMVEQIYMINYTE